MTEELKTMKVRFIEIVAALARGLNLVAGHDPWNNIITAVLVVHIARSYNQRELARAQLGEWRQRLRWQIDCMLAWLQRKPLPATPRLLTTFDIAVLLYAALLKDVGCSANAKATAKAFDMDDLHIKRHLAFVKPNCSYSQLKFVLAHAGKRQFANEGRGKRLRRRLATILRVIAKRKELTEEAISLRCHRGGAIISKLGFEKEGFGQAVADTVAQLNEYWNGGGYPAGIKGGQILLTARILRVAHVATAFLTRYGGRDSQGACAAVRNWSGSVLDPECVAAFLDAQRRPGFWDIFKETATLQQHIVALEEELEPEPQTINFQQLIAIAEAFAMAIDARSSYTGGHVFRVGTYSRDIAQALNLAGVTSFTDEELDLIYIAGILHDMGKIGIADEILYAPRGLTEAEWQQMRNHPIWGHEILSGIDVLKVAAMVALCHHESFFGGGYPRGLKGEEIPLIARIVTVADAFDALASLRPYNRTEDEQPLDRPIPVVLDTLEGEAGLKPLPADDPRAKLRYDPQIVRVVRFCVSLWTKEIAASKQKAA